MVSALVSELKAKLLEPGMDTLNFDRVSGDIDKVVIAARTPPMMAEKRLVVGHFDKAPNADKVAPLIEYLKEPVESTCLLLMFAQLDARSALRKAVASSLIETGPLNRQQMTLYLKRQAEQRRVKLDPDAIELLWTLLGEDISAQTDALERLSLYVLPKKTISADDVSVCVSKIKETSIWALMDAISERDAKGAASLIESLVQEGESAIKIGQLMARQIRMLIKMKAALETRVESSALPQRVGVPPFKVQSVAKASRAFSVEQLTRALAELHQLDRALKSSRTPEPVLAQAAVLALTRR